MTDLQAQLAKCVMSTQYFVKRDQFPGEIPSNALRNAVMAPVPKTLCNVDRLELFVRCLGFLSFPFDLCLLRSFILSSLRNLSLLDSLLDESEY